MEWISSRELIEMLKRFPGTKIEARCYSGSLYSPLHTWMFQKDNGKFSHYYEGKAKDLTESKLLKEYDSDHWRPEPFFFLTDEKQKALAVRIVEHLIMTGNLDSVICECEINFVRQCDHCHKLMNEGWWCGDTYHYCSDRCLLDENPWMTQEKLDKLVVDDDSEIYWTEWED